MKKYILSITLIVLLFAFNSAFAMGMPTAGMDLETVNGVSYLMPHGTDQDLTMQNRLLGRILLQVQSSGQAWWIEPITGSRVSLGSPSDAYQVMRAHGLGISDTDLAKILTSDQTSTSTSALAKRLAGRILLQVQSHGEAWYINPLNFKRYFLGRPADAFTIMRSLGLGITNTDLNKIHIQFGKVGQREVDVILTSVNSSGQSGIAQLTEVNGQVKINIMLNGTPAGVAEPAHIHLGNTPNLGAIKYPLNDVINGKSETILNLTLDQLLSQRPLGINVHQSASNLAVIEANGNL